MKRKIEYYKDENEMLGRENEELRKSAKLWKVGTAISSLIAVILMVVYL